MVGRCFRLRRGGQLAFSVKGIKANAAFGYIPLGLGRSVQLNMKAISVPATGHVQRMYEDPSL